MDDQETWHKRYAAIVKGTHSHLRNQLKKADGDFAHVWEEHCQNKDLLDKYANAMHKLATKIWTKKSETRIHWCRNVCNEYFLYGGLAKLRQKEERKWVHEARSAQLQTLKGYDCDRSETCAFSEQSNQRITNTDDVVNDQIHSTEMLPKCSTSDPVLKLKQMALPLPPAVQNWSTRLRYGCLAGEDLSGNDKEPMLKSVTGSENEILETIGLPFKGRISLLDVGSCYNPFQEFEEFAAFGIDLCPAIESVHRCDFLQLEIFQNFELNSSMQELLTCLQSPVTKLPEKSFHVVVFSLLLEYLPSPQQRWICCQKAHQLLMLDGLLLIISPDSHHQQRNAPMMKGWKKAIESMGFTRWRYIKQEHLHCMAFRKLNSNSAFGEITAEMLYIPQDFNIKDEKEDERTKTRLHLQPVIDSEYDFMDHLNEINFDD